MTHNQIAEKILDAAFLIHREMGLGLLESVYETLMELELQALGISVKRQHPIAIRWKGYEIKDAFRADLLVEEKVFVEIKSVEDTKPVFAKQLRTYLVLAEKKLGLLINFNVVMLKDGIRRVVNKLDESEYECPTAAQ